MQTVSARQTQTQVLTNAFIRSVYNWMAIGLALTGFIAYYVASTEPILRVVYQARWIFFIAEIGLVFALAGRVHKMKASTATFLFLLYAGLNGATMSIIFLVYTMESIASTFFICAATFTVCSIFGYVTKRDLTGLGQFMFMGLIGIIIASIVNMFLGSHGVAMIISYIGVIVFVGLTAYDTQKLKAMAMSQPAGLDAGTIRKGSILGALTLYLDFILMFQYLLMIFGGSRD
jgi:FtsH-binding integral membrane protein